MGSVCLRGFSFLSFLLVLAARSEGSSMVQVPTAVLASQSAWIGRVEIISSRVIQREVPFEVLSAKVLEVYRGRGQVGDTVLFSKPGGRGQKKTFAVVGVPQLLNEKQYVVFLSEDPLFSYREDSVEPQLQSWTAYEVLTNSDGKPERVRRAEGAIHSKASRAYATGMSFGVGASSYDDLVTQIYRGLD